MTMVPALRVLTRGEHSIQDPAIHPDAWKVLRRLHNSGHTAYLVGGTVRDLYLGRPPKDFDVATTAKPNEIKRLFRNAFMIGRRFRLAHIKFHDSIIEVATFRRETDRFEEPAEAGGDARAIRLYGTPEEDARRRDFTINGLFYDPFRGHVIDYVSGLADMERKLVRTISPPDQSFEEDPARMIRAVRAAARLGFVVEMQTHDAIVQNRGKILRCPKPRLLEELLILLKYNSAERSLRLLWRFGLMEFLLPMHHSYLLRHEHIPFDSPKTDLLFDLLSMLDLETAPVDAPILFSILIFPFIAERLSISPRDFWSHRSTGQLIGLVESIFSELAKAVDVSKRFRARAVEILSVQNKFILSQSQMRPEKMAHKPYFQDSFRFFQIVSKAVDLDVKKDIAIWQKYKFSPVEKLESKKGPAIKDENRQFSPPSGHSQGPGRHGVRRRRRGAFRPPAQISNEPSSKVQ